MIDKFIRSAETPMNSIKELVRIMSFIVCFTGCAAVGVFPTSNPDKKLQNAYSMATQGRYLRATQFTEEALEIYKSKDDKINEARSHSMLGDFYRDGTGRGFPDYAKSIEHYGKAAEIQRSLKRPKWESFNLYAQAGVKNIQGEKKAACKTLREAEEVYSRAPNKDQKTESFEKAGYFDLDRFDFLKKKFGC